MFVRSVILFLAVFGLVSQAAAQLNGNVYDGNGGPLVRGQVYTASGPISVPTGETLTVEIGAILKLDATSISVHGTLNVVDNGAAPGEMAIFTSLHDDVGGNTNQSPQQPAAGDWHHLLFSLGAGTVDRLEVRYAGGGNQPCVRVTTSPTFVDCVIRDGANAALGFTSQSQATFTRCAFNDCVRPVNPVPMGTVPGFVDCTANGNTEGDSMKAADTQWTGAVTIGTNNLFADNVLKLDTPTVSAGTSLELLEGVICKMRVLGLLTVAGDLYCRGTAANPVILTSIHDNASGGNSNGTVPKPPVARGDWRNVATVPGSVVEMDYTHIRYGGFSGAAAIWLRTGIQMDHCLIEECDGDGLNMQQLAVPQDVAITNCEFHNNTGVAMERVQWRALPKMRDNTATGNDGGDVAQVYESAINGNIEIYPWNYPGDVLVCSWALAVLPTDSLTLHPGVIIKQFAAVANSIQGTLNINGSGHRKVVITSIDDDSIAGDTMKDGPPAADPVAWYGLPIGTAANIRIHHALFAWVGWAGRPTLDLMAPNYDLFGVRVSNASGAAFQMREQGTITQCAAWRARVGFSISGNASGQEIPFCTAAECSWRGFLISSPSACTVKNCISYGNLVDFYFNAATLNGENSCSGQGQLPLGFGNITADPQFVDVANGDLRLSATSPCVGQGLAALPPPLPVVDIDENSRRSDPELTGVDNPDMGAYERVRWTFDVDGWLRPNQSFGYGARGPAGFYFVGVGSDFWAAHIPPLGYLVITPLYPAPLSPLGPHLIGAAGDVSLQMPPALPPGITINLQAVCFGDAGSGGGAGFTNVCRLKTFDQ